MSRKRKSPDDSPISRDPKTGILSPASTEYSRSSSVQSVSSVSAPEDGDIYVYNGVLERKEGWIVAKKVRGRAFARDS